MTSGIAASWNRNARTPRPRNSPCPQLSRLLQRWWGA